MGFVDGVSNSTEENPTNFVFITFPNVCYNKRFPVSLSGVSNKIYIPYKDTFGENFIQGTVSGIDPSKKEVWVEGCPTVSYDMLVIATGGTSPFPAHGGAMNKSEAVEAYTDFLEKVQLRLNQR